MRDWAERHIEMLLKLAMFVVTLLGIAVGFYADYTYKKAILRDALREAAEATK